MIRTFLLASLMAVGLCLPGGFNEVTDPTQVQAAKDLLNGLQTNGMLTLDSSCTVQKIEKQIVAGENIRYTMSCSGHTCHLVVFNQVWTSTLKVTENQCVQKRQLGMVGGYYTQTDAAAIKTYTDKLTALVSAGLLTLEQYTVVKVETQVVSGVNIKYTIQKDDGTTCTIVVWEQSWTNMHQITTNTCSKTRRQLGGGLLGGWSNCDKDLPEIQQCISKSLDSINGMSNSLFRMVDSHVISAKQQVVAGMNYAVTFQTLPSTCMNNQAMFGKTSADCPVDANSVQQPSSWKAQCYKHLDGTFDLTDVSLV